MKIQSFLLGLFFVSSFASAAVCPRPWVCSVDEMTIPYTTTLTETTRFTKAAIRSGYLPEKGSFKGNILYLQGLGDSMLNHDPLFTKLSANGFRVIAFDYMGQGGSTGDMNNTRIKVISQIGGLIWKKWAKASGPVTLMGWSTGGLAAYLATTSFKIDRIILIAPGLVPNMIVGEGVTQWPINQISLATLTSDSYSGLNSNPHVDPIRPGSPMVVLEFAKDLFFNAWESQRTMIPKTVQGFVLLSGKGDNYVNAAQTLKVIQRTAPHFKTVTYDGALHEIDNEKKLIREKAHSDIIQFLDATQKFL